MQHQPQPRRVQLSSVTLGVQAPMPPQQAVDPLETYRMEKARESLASVEQFRQYQQSLRPVASASAALSPAAPAPPADPVQAYLDAHGGKRTAAPPDAAAATAAPATTLNAAEQEELARCVETWKRDRYVLEKCRANLQQAKLNHRESETRLKQVLHSPLLVDIRPPPRKGGDPGADDDADPDEEHGNEDGKPKLILVSEIERKKALTVQTIRQLLRRELGETQGDKLFQTLMDNRGVKRERVIQCRRAPAASQKK